MNDDICCPVFDPAPWDEQEIIWQDKLFAKARVRSFLHIPFNASAVITRTLKTIEGSKAKFLDNLIVWDDHSIWGTDLFFAIDQEVPGLESERISGTFFAKVFEGPYKEIPRWIETMKNILAQKQKTLKGLLFYYTTCPKCAKKQGKNPVVLLARI